MTPAAALSSCDPTHTGDVPERPVPPPEPPPSDRMPYSERYEILGEHGRGGLGRVSRARDRALGRDIAIKELISRGHVSEIRFLREALIAARLEHPGIVPIYEAGRWPDGTPFYAMKLVAGRSLRDLIAERTTVEDRIGLLHHVIAVADAIAYAHGRNVIHRDLKPANIIVGDFGETIVIDWGLAKDLTSLEDAASGGGTAAAASVDDLTNAGAILGTPKYMAPEQRRGERVDKRADVFAIGAMLWELCVLAKLPPGERHVRHRMLRRSGIEVDLVAIIDKALEADPERRYPDAGAIAADLKAFKSGARITARSYGLLALLARWTRTHRTLAVSVTAALAVAVAGAVLYVRDIAVERDRADAALVQAESARRAAQIANDATETTLAVQTLDHAALLLSSDPTSALDVLARYRGSDALRRELLRTEAVGRGVARMQAAPHTRPILWVRGLANHAVATRSADGTIAHTSATGAVTVIARDAATKYTHAYAERRQLFAYPCKAAAICVVDFSQPVPVVLPPLGNDDANGLAFSPSENRLAALAPDGSVTIWDVSDLGHPRAERLADRAHGYLLYFLDEDTVAAGDVEKLVLLGPGRAPVSFAIAGMTAFKVSDKRRALVVGTSRGTATLITPGSRRVGRFTRLCDGAIDSITTTRKVDEVAYGCDNGHVGLWDLRDSPATSLVRLFTTRRGVAEFVVPSADGRELAVAGNAGTFWIIDFATRMVTSYAGHSVRITAIAAPDASYPHYVSVDANGHVRTWPRRHALARVAHTVPHYMFDTRFLADSVTAVATSPIPSLHFASPAGVRDIGPHDVSASHLETSPDQTRFATYGWGGDIELWSGTERRRLEVIRSKQPATVRLAFLSDDDMVWAGNDGRILRWSSARGMSTVAMLPQPIAMFAVLPRDQSLVAALADGALWRVTLDGKSQPLASQTDKAAVMHASRDGRWLATGSADGIAVVYDTEAWRPSTVLRAAGAIRQIAFSPRSDLLAVATTAGQVHLGRSAGPRATLDDPSRLTWTSFAAQPRELAFSTRGDLLMIACADGVMWFHALDRDRWLYFPTGGGNITSLVAAADDRSAAGVDSGGRLLVFDLLAVRAALDRGPYEPP